MSESWTDKEIRILRRLYPRYSNRDVAFFMLRTAVSIRSKAFDLGLGKSVIYDNMRKKSALDYKVGR